MNCRDCGKPTRANTGQCFGCFQETAGIEKPHACELCGEPSEHELCGDCRACIGYSHRDPALLRKAADWLEKALE